jgi:hypothetical protein
MNLRKYINNSTPFREVIITDVKASSIGTLDHREKERIIEHALHLLHRETYGSTSAMSHSMMGRDIIPIVVIVEVDRHDYPKATPMSEEKAEKIIKEVKPKINLKLLLP